MKKKSDPTPQTGKIPIDGVTFVKTGTGYQYNLSFAGTRTVNQSVTVATYLVASNATYAEVLRQHVPAFPPTQTTIIMDEVAPLPPGNYITVAFTDSHLQDAPKLHRYWEPMTIDDQYARRHEDNEPVTGKIPIDGITLVQPIPSNPTHIVMLTLNLKHALAGSSVPVFVRVVMDDGSFNPIVVDLPSTFTVPANPPPTVDHNAGSFQRPPTHNADITAFTNPDTDNVQTRRRFYPIGFP